MLPDPRDRELSVGDATAAGGIGGQDALIPQVGRKKVSNNRHGLPEDQRSEPCQPSLLQQKISGFQLIV